MRSGDVGVKKGENREGGEMGVGREGEEREGEGMREERGRVRGEENV